MKRCYRCGAEWVAEKKQPGVKEFCPSCSAYLHCCLNCRFYDTHAHNKCTIPTTDWVGDRAGPNFCDEFDFKDAAPNERDGAAKDMAREAFEGLFGDTDDRSDSDKGGMEGFHKLLGDE